MTPKAAAALERVEKFVARYRGLRPEETVVAYAWEQVNGQEVNHVALDISDLKLVIKLAKACNVERGK